MTDEQHTTGPGRCTLLSVAAALGAGGAVIGTAASAQARPARNGGGGHGAPALPVPTIVGHRGSAGPGTSSWPETGAPSPTW